MKGLRMDGFAERLVDQGDVRSAEQPVDVLRCPKHDPVERQLEQIPAGLNAHLFGVRRSAWFCLQFSYVFLGPGPIPGNNHSAELACRTSKIVGC